MRLVPESEIGSPDDSSEPQPPEFETADEIWHALAEELARNRSLNTAEELVVPWQAAAPGDVRTLMSAYRDARATVRQLRLALDRLGLGNELPDLCASVDARGTAVVVLGTVSVRAASGLAAALRSPQPPADRRAA